MTDYQPQTRDSDAWVAAPIIRANGVSCTYGQFLAVDDVTLSVTAGQIHALLGTNGAGKTTLLESIQGFRRIAQGELSVFGQDPWRHRTSVAGRVGTMLQESGLVDEMTVGGQMTLWQGLNLREDRVDRVLGVVGLEHRKKTPVSVLSGGERRRLDFAMAIWGDPELVVLDEPTTGLDPQSRRTMWSIIRELNSRGTTVLLTTHNLEEAQNLADYVTIVDRGRVAIEGPMAEVLDTIPSQISFDITAQLESILDLKLRISGDATMSETRASDTDGEPNGQTTVTIRTPRLQTDVGLVIDWSRDQNLTLEQFRCAPASLEEVFFGMTTVETDPVPREKAAR